MTRIFFSPNETSLPGRRLAWFSSMWRRASLCAVGLAVLLARPAFAAPAETQLETPLRGRVVCLVEELARTSDVDILADHQHLWGFKTGDGELYTLLQTRLSEALFLDPRLREKELLIKGRVFSQSQILEAVNLQSIKDGVVHDLYYYCFVCSIKTVSPRECLCCHQPVELIEKPVNSDSGSTELP